MFWKSIIKYLVWPVLWMLVMAATMGVSAPAAEFTVNTTADTVDVNPGDGVAIDKNGSCSLRAAVMEANALVGPDTIFLGPTAFQLTIAGAGEDKGLTGDLDIFSNLTIKGSGTLETIIDANGIDRVLHIRGDWKVTVSDLTIRNGRSPDGYWDDSISAFRFGGNGGGILNRNGKLNLVRCCVTQNRTGNGKVIYSGSGGPFYAGNGGGIYCNGGRLDMEDSTVSENFTGFGFSNYDSYGLMGCGGGMYLVDCRSELRKCTVNNNQLPGSEFLDVGVEANGVGLYLYRGEAILRNCTVSHNIGVGVWGSGGGIFVQGNQLSLIYCTIVRNEIKASYGGGGGVYYNSWNERNSVKGTIIAENIAGIHYSEGHDIYGRFDSLGYNLIGDPMGWWLYQSAPGDLVGEPPHLGPLRDNGGPTKTHALLPQSLGIDAADPQETEATDQRGVARPQDGDSDLAAVADIGAFEVSFPSVSIVSPMNGSTLRGNVTIEAKAENCEHVLVYIDGGVAAELTEEPYVFEWNTESYANGAHQIAVIAEDLMGQTATDGIAVFLDNILVLLEVERRVESSWLLRREYADLRISIPNLSLSVVDRVEVQRQLGGGVFQTIREVEATEFENNLCSCHDLLPRTAGTVTYQAVALDGAGNVMGQSPKKGL